MKKKKPTHPFFFKPPHPAFSKPNLLPLHACLFSLKLPTSCLCNTLANLRLVLYFCVVLVHFKYVKGGV